MSDMATILVVDDDPIVRDVVVRYLKRDGHRTLVAGDGDRADELLRQEALDLVVLDVMLPGRDGLALSRSIRSRSSLPIILLTARGEEADRIVGLELGADDYVTKPFSARELLARIQAVVRRAEGRAGPRAREVKVGRVIVDSGSLRATLDGQLLALTSYEFALLRALAENAGKVLTRERLLDLAKGNAEEAFDRSVDVRISRLRQKLGDDPRHPRLLKTVRGSGYMLVAEESA